TPAAMEYCLTGIGDASDTKPAPVALVVMLGTLMAAAPLNCSDKHRASTALPADTPPILRRKSPSAVIAKLSAHPAVPIVAGPAGARARRWTAGGRPWPGRRRRAPDTIPLGGGALGAATPPRTKRPPARVRRGRGSSIGAGGRAIIPDMVTPP